MESDAARVTKLMDDVAKYQDQVNELRWYLTRENRRVSDLIERLDEVLREFPGYLGAPSSDRDAAAGMAREKRIADLRERTAHALIELSEQRVIDGRDGMDRWTT